jgi:hypothetical protein
MAAASPAPPPGYGPVPKSDAEMGVTSAKNPAHATDLLRSMIGQGALAGFGDEAEAGARATYAKAPGDKRSFSEIYDQELKSVRSKVEKFNKEHSDIAGLSEGAPYGGDGASSSPLGGLVIARDGYHAIGITLLVLRTSAGMMNFLSHDL